MTPSKSELEERALLLMEIINSEIAAATAVLKGKTTILSIPDAAFLLDSLRFATKRAKRLAQDLEAYYADDHG